MENNNEYSHLTLEELWDLQSAKEKELEEQLEAPVNYYICLLYTSPSPRDS